MSDPDYRQQEENEECRWHVERGLADVDTRSQTRRMCNTGGTKMGFKMKVTNGGNFANPTPGTVGAVCTRVIDMGTQESQWGAKRRVLISFEIDERMDDGRPFLVSSSYTHSLDRKANLRQALESWRGKSLSEESYFDLSLILGKPALLNLVESDKGYTNIRSISPLPKGMQAPKPEGKTILFNLDEPDWDAFNDLSEKLQEKIAQSPEYQRAMGKDVPVTSAPTGTVGPEPVVAGADDPDDDIPF